MPSKITMYQEGEDDIPTPAEGAKTLFLGADDAFKTKDSNGVVDPIEMNLSDAVPQPVGAGAAGNATSASRSNHVHDHGNQGGGSLHALVTTSASGFLSAGDKSQLDLLISNWAAIETTDTTTTLTTTQGTLLVDASGAPVTVNLPAASGADRKIYNVKKTDASANIVTVDADSAEEIDGATTQSVSTQYENLMIQSDGAAWWVLTRSIAS